MKKLIALLALAAISLPAAAFDYPVDWVAGGNVDSYRVYIATDVDVIDGKITNVTWSPVPIAESTALPVMVTLPDVDEWMLLQICSSGPGGQTCRGSGFWANPMHEPPAVPADITAP